MYCAVFTNISDEDLNTIDRMDIHGEVATELIQGIALDNIKKEEIIPYGQFIIAIPETIHPENAEAIEDALADALHDMGITNAVVHSAVTGNETSTLLTIEMKNRES